MRILSFLDLPSIRCKKLCEWLNLNESLNISFLKDENFLGSFYKCEIASTPFVLAILAKMLDEKSFYELDEGYLSAESCFGEEEAFEVLEFLKNADLIIFDANLKRHKDYENIAFFLNFLSKSLKLKTLCSNDLKDLEKDDFKDEKKLFAKSFNFDESFKFTKLKELDNYDGAVIFNLDLKDDFIHCKKAFAMILKAKFNEKLNLKAGDKGFESELLMDESLNTNLGFLNFKAFGLEKNYDFLKLSLDKKA